MQIKFIGQHDPKTRKELPAKVLDVYLRDLSAIHRVSLFFLFNCLVSCYDRFTEQYAKMVEKYLTTIMFEVNIFELTKI